MGELAERLHDEIDRVGPLPFSRFVDRALYEPRLGFYEHAGRAGGRGGDFVTSVETGPLFAAVIGEWLDARWVAAGCPSTFVVAEAAAGVGTLWRGILRAAPRCFDALEWLLVERSARLRSEHQSLPGERRRSLADLPQHSVDVVLANELLDNLAFDIAERTVAGWRPVLVDRAGAGFAFELGAEPVDGIDGVAPDAEIGARVPVPVGAREWLDRAITCADRVLVFDYGAPTAELARRGQGWLRTFAGHERGDDPLIDPGSRDITHDVPIDQLLAPARSSSQAAWLREHGIDERVSAARAVWDERAAIGDLEAMFARSAINEAAALTDPGGLGGFLAIEWDGRHQGG